MPDKEKKPLQTNFKSSLAPLGKSDTKPPPVQGSKGDQDHQLKLAAARAFACQGYVVKINVNLSESAYVQPGRRSLAGVTDIDVLAIKYNYDYSPFIICMSCKSGRARNLSPIRESFFLRGVMEYFGASRGYVVCSNKTVDSHARILASKLNVTVLDGQEFAEWCVYACSSCDSDLSHQWQMPLYNRISNEIQKVNAHELKDYINTYYWFYRDFRNLQNLIAYSKRAKTYIGKLSLPVSVVICEIASLLSLTLLDLCRYISLNGIRDINDHVKAYLFGGITSFKSRKDLYIKLKTFLRSLGVVQESGPQLPELIPDYADTLIELIYRWLSKPGAAIFVPQAIQDHQWNLVLNDKQAITCRGDYPDTTLKFADDLMEFLSRAAGIPKENII